MLFPNVKSRPAMTWVSADNLVIQWGKFCNHVNDNSLFCVFTSLDVIYSPNNRFITEMMVHPCFVDHTTVWNNHASFVSSSSHVSYLAGVTLNA